MHFTGSDLSEMNNIVRLNLVNSITGIKPANLIGTHSEKTGSNLAVFSSIVHLGSYPPLIGFVTRPVDEVSRDTWENIQQNGVFTVNHVHTGMIQRAHYTSAKFDSDESEFNKCKLTEEWLFDFPAPFVTESTTKIGLDFRQAVPLELNETVLVIGEVKHIVVADDVMDKSGQCDLGVADGVGISGLNRYYSVQRLNEFPYARTSELPDFSKEIQGDSKTRE